MANRKKITIVGAGPTGLFCASLLLKHGFEVDLYDQMSGIGKKFLVAGKGGLNLTHSENLNQFSSKYGKHKIFFAQLLNEFSPDDLRKWCQTLGVKTFIGSSGRVFPNSFKAAEILRAWLAKLKSFNGFKLYLNHSLKEIINNKTLVFEHDKQSKVISCQTIIFSLGGGSWKITGSNGQWGDLFKKKLINTTPLRAVNCGFETSWSNHFKNTFQTEPLKNISIRLNKQVVLGEAMLTQYGIEGGAVYTLSLAIQNELRVNNRVDIYLNLKPNLTLETIKQRLENKKTKTSFSNHLRKSLKLTSVNIKLIMELVPKEDMNVVSKLANHIQNLKISLNSSRPIDQAISTSGGIIFDEIDHNFMLKRLSDCYVAGEMVDWEAPTGGYLLQGCFSSAFRVAKSIIHN